MLEAILRFARPAMRRSGDAVKMGKPTARSPAISASEITAQLPTAFENMRLAKTYAGRMAQMIRVVVLVLTVYNTANGDKLYEASMDFDRMSVNGNLIEDCRVWGVNAAKRLTEEWREQGYDASTNVNCHWEDRSGAPA